MRFFIIHITACLLYSNVRTDGFHLGPSALKRPFRWFLLGPSALKCLFRWVSSWAFGPQMSVQMGFFSGLQMSVQMGFFSGLRPSNIHSDEFISGLRPSNVRSDGFHLGPSALKRPLRWVSSRAFGPQTSIQMSSSRAFGPQTSAQMGFISGHRPSNVRSDGIHLGPSALKCPFRWFHLGPSALKCPFRWVSSRAFGPQASVQMGFISGLRPSNVRSDCFFSGLRPSNVRSDGFLLGPSALKRRRLGFRPQNAPDVSVVPLPQNSNTRNLVKVDPNFLEKIFLYSTHQGLSNDILIDPLYSFLVQVIFYPKILGGFSPKFLKNHNFFNDILLNCFKVLLFVEKHALFSKNTFPYIQFQKPQEIP